MPSGRRIVTNKGRSIEEPSGLANFHAQHENPAQVSVALGGSDLACTFPYHLITTTWTNNISASYFTPIYIPKAMTISNFRLFLTTAATGSSTIYIFLYKIDPNGMWYKVGSNATTSNILLSGANTYVSVALTSSVSAVEGMYGIGYLQAAGGGVPIALGAVPNTGGSSGLAICDAATVASTLFWGTGTARTTAMNMTWFWEGLQGGSGTPQAQLPEAFVPGFSHSGASTAVGPSPMQWWGVS